MARWLAWALVLTAGGALAGEEYAVAREKAQAALLAGDYERAVELAGELIAQAPAEGAGYLIRGTALANLGRWGEAEEDLLRARAAFPTDATVSYNLALAAAHRGDFKRALAYLDEAFAHGLNRSDAYILKATALDRLGRRNEGRTFLEEYLKKRPASRDVILTLAQWARADGDFGRALEYYNEVLKYGRPGSVVAEVASIYEAAGDRDRAVELYLEAMAKGAATAGLLAEYATDYAAAGEPAKAAAIYEKLVAKYPEDASYVFGLAFAKQQLGDARGAEALYRRAVTLRPDFAEAYYNLGALADADERAEEAVQYYEKFLTCAAGRDDLAGSREKARARLRILKGE